MSAGEACPCCGKEWSPPADGMKAVVERNAVYIDGALVPFTPKQTQIIATILDSAPYPCHRFVIAEHLFGQDEAQWPYNWSQRISVWLAYIRGHLRPLGYVVARVPTRGYKIEKTSEPVVRLKLNGGGDANGLPGEDRRPGHDARRAPLFKAKGTETERVRRPARHRARG